MIGIVAVHSMYYDFSGACSDWSNWDYIDAYRNISEAMKMAEDWLNVEQVSQPCLLPQVRKY